MKYKANITRERKRGERRWSNDLFRNITSIVPYIRSFFFVLVLKIDASGARHVYDAFA